MATVVLSLLAAPPASKGGGMPGWAWAVFVVVFVPFAVLSMRGAVHRLSQWHDRHMPPPGSDSAHRKGAE